MNSKEKMTNLVEEIKNSVLEEVMVEVEKLFQEIIDGLPNVNLSNLKSHLKGENGEKPTNDELVALIKPLIPPIKDGKTPTKQELIKLIKPLIPPAKDGKTPTKEELLKLIELVSPKVSEETQETPEQLADKLNTLDEKIEQGTIKGLKEMFNNLRKSIRENVRGKGGGGGGGMGNVVFKTFSVNSSTTTLTLDSAPSSGGNALILIYQGQVLENGTHFTISGNTITLTFTAQDNTTMFAWMIR